MGPRGLPGDRRRPLSSRLGRGRRWLLILGVVLAALVPGVAAVASTSARQARRSCAGRLHGTMRGHNVRLSGCRTYVVTGTLKINATGTVTIARPLQVARGAGLTITAAKIAIKAPVGPQPVRASARAAQAAGGCLAEPALHLNGFFGVTVDASVTGASGGTNASGSGCLGQFIFINASHGGVDINAPVTAGDGGPGRQYRLVTGTNGGCHGSGRPLEVHGGPGGDGGSVFVIGHSGVTGGAVTGERLIRAGNGGAGGSVVGVGLDGGDQESGMGVLAAPGSGGDGGDAALFYNRHDHPFGHAGAGGSPGNANATAGDGGPPNCDGGDTVVSLGDNGAGGSGSLDPLKRTHWSSVRVSGGNGADATPPPSPLRGGFGGAVDIVGGTPVPGANKDVTGFVQYLSISGAGNGGKGSNGCPASPGGNGGRGGPLESLHPQRGSGKILVLSTNVADRIVSHSFNGANGGDGMPPGLGGAAGTDPADGPLVIDKSFMPGNPGQPCPVGSSRTATGSLTDDGTGLLAYSVQTNQPANAFRVTLPAGNDITGSIFPSGFICTDAANQETCKGGSVAANAPLGGSFRHTGTIDANCGCVGIDFSSDNGTTWYPVTPVRLLGPPTPSPGTGTPQPFSAAILNPTGLGTFLDGPLGGGTTSDLPFQGQISGGTAPYTATIDWGDGTTTSGLTGMHAFPATTSLSDGKMTYPLTFHAADSAGHNTSIPVTITVECSGISGPGFTADLGAGSAPTIVFCGHWQDGFEPAKVLVMPAAGQSWQFSGSFNIFESTELCPDSTVILVGACKVKIKVLNPTLLFGVAANINTPVVAGMKITVEGEDSTGQVRQSFTGTVM